MNISQTVDCLLFERIKNPSKVVLAFTESTLGEYIKYELVSILHIDYFKSPMLISLHPSHPVMIE